MNDKLFDFLLDICRILVSILAVYIAFRVIKILDVVFALEEGTIGCKLDTHSKTSSTFSFFSRL